MSPLSFVALAAGMVVLVAGAELLVRGASRLAARFGVSPLVISLTVVAFGTSAPELAVCLQSSFGGNADIGVGNIVGSNISNVLLILGISALILPLAVNQQLVRIDVPILIALSFLVLVLSRDGALGRLDGGLLVGLGIVYTVFVIRESRRESAAVQAEYAREYGEKAGNARRPWPVPAATVLAGLLLLVLGARWLVAGAVDLATWLGLSELVIGLTVVAIGTSLPELATSVIAGLRGERDIAVGNVVGSNVLNLVLVLGLSAAVAPEALPVAQAALHFDLPVMTAVAVACLPIFFTGHRIDRWEGMLFLAYYLAYVAYLVLQATEHATLGPFSRVMILFVLPLTALTLALLVIRSLRARASRRSAA